MKNHLLFISLASVIMVGIVIMAGPWMISSRTEAHSYPVPPYKIAKRITLKELIDVANANDLDLYLPTKMPGNIKLVAIYYKPPVVMLSYCDREVIDYRYDNVTIEISLWLHILPSQEELKLIAEEDLNNLKMLNVNDAKGILIKPGGEIPNFKSCTDPHPMPFSGLAITTIRFPSPLRLTATR